MCIQQLKKFVFGLLLLLIVVGCKGSLTTETSSDKFPSKEERVTFLKKYVTVYSDVIDTQFYIDYHDNSGMPPGPSDWNILVAMKVPPETVKDWVDKDFEAVSGQEVKLSWWDTLKLDDTIWSRSSQPKFYTKKNQSIYMAIYEQEGIILKKMSAM